MYKFLLCSIFFTNSIVYAQTCNPNINRTAPDSRYRLVVGSGGSEVLDTQTKLIWQRCSVGQTWNGTTCTGTATNHRWIDALANAKALGNGYRLPNIKELQSLVEEACSNNAINEAYFPQTQSAWYMSASRLSASGLDVLGVDFRDGTLTHIVQTYIYARAVRASP